MWKIWCIKIIVLATYVKCDFEELNENLPHNVHNTETSPSLLDTTPEKAEFRIWFPPPENEIIEDINVADEPAPRDGGRNMEKKFLQRMRPRCASGGPHGGGLCENDDEYDETIQECFEKALTKVNITRSTFNAFFGELMIDNLPANDATIATRTGSIEPLEDPVCPALERVIFPQRGMTRSNEWVFLLNQGTMRQGVKVEECLNTTGSAMLMDSSSVSCSLYTNDIESVCRQKYIFRKMIAIDATGSNIVTESILIPSCCICRRRKTFNVETRISSVDDVEYPEINLEVGNTPTNKIEDPVSESVNQELENQQIFFVIP